MHVFITGGSGFVGGHLIRRLRADGHAVVAAARSTAAARAVEQAGAEPWCGALEDLEALTRALDGADALVHAAARLQMWGPIAEFESANIDLTRSVLAAARRAAVPRFVQIGAASVVMDAPVALLDVDESARRTASDALPYSSSKARAEALVIAARADGLETIVLRPPFIWGPGDAVDRDLGAAVARGRFGWFDGGRYPYATCHVANLAEAVICALTVPDAAGAYFVSDDEPVELRVFLARRIAAAGLRVPRVSIPSGAAWALAGAVDALWRVLHLRAEPPLTREVVRLMGFPFTLDISRARQGLGYRPVVSVEEGMRRLERGGATANEHGSLAGAPPSRPPHRDVA